MQSALLRIVTRQFFPIRDFLIMPLQTASNPCFKLLLISVLAFSLFGAAHATTPVYEWHALFQSGAPLAQVIDSEGNSITAGVATESWVGNGNQNPVHGYTGQGNVWLLKLDSSGNYLWHTFVGDSTTVSGHFMIDLDVDAAGDIYLTGNVWIGAVWNGPNGELPLEGFHGGNLDGYLAKINSAGQYQWHRFIGPDGSTAVEATYAVAVDSAGDIYTSSANIRGGFFVEKYSPLGERTWRDRYGLAGQYGQGDIFIDENDNIFVANYSPGGKPFNFIDENGVERLPRNSLSVGYEMGIHLVKLSSDGEYFWHTFQGERITPASNGNSVKITVETSSAGDVYIAGTANGAWTVDFVDPLQPFRGSTDIAVTKLDSSGDYQWHVFWGDDQPEFGARMILDDEDNVIVTSRTEDNWLGPNGEQPFAPLLNNFGSVLLGMDANGTYLWHTFFNGPLSTVASDSTSLYLGGYGRYETNPRFTELNLLGTDTRLPLSGTNPIEGGVVAKYQYGVFNIDDEPDAFGFTAEIDVPLSALVLSQSVSITGLNTASEITITGGEYSLDDEDFTSALGSISNAQTVRIRLPASESFNASTSAVLTIGGISAIFSATTLADNTTDPRTVDIDTVDVPPSGSSGGSFNLVFNFGLLLFVALRFCVSRLVFKRS